MLCGEGRLRSVRVQLKLKSMREEILDILSSFLAHLGIIAIMGTILWYLGDHTRFNISWWEYATALAAIYYSFRLARLGWK